MKAVDLLESVYQTGYTNCKPNYYAILNSIKSNKAAVIQNLQGLDPTMRVHDPFVSIDELLEKTHIPAQDISKPAAQKIAELRIKTRYKIESAKLKFLASNYDGSISRSIETMMGVRRPITEGLGYNPEIVNELSAIDKLLDLYVEAILSGGLLRK